MFVSCYQLEHMAQNAHYQDNADADADVSFSLSLSLSLSLARELDAHYKPSPIILFLVSFLSTHNGTLVDISE